LSKRYETVAFSNKLSGCIETSIVNSYS